MTSADLVVTAWGARFMGRRFPCAVGRGGFSKDKHEGDGATPRGPMRLVGLPYRADRRPPLGTALPQRRIGPRAIWSDDPADPDYNHGAEAANYPFSHEVLFRSDRLYDRIGLTDHNWPDAAPGKGSAIFLHRWRKPRHPTEGCVAFAPAHLDWILSRWTPHSRIWVIGACAPRK